MSITDELREWFKDRIFMANGWQEIRDIADRIDAEHGETVAFCRRLEDAAKGHEDLDMWGTAYTALPVDADGVPIRVGDEMDGYGKTIEVVELRIGRSGWVIVSGDGNAYADTIAFSHHHAPTVEDVLRELLDAWDGRGDTGGIDLSEYAAKLRLAGDAE